MNFKSISAIALSVVVFAACNRVSVTETGLKYQFHDQDSDGRKAKTGEIMSLHLTIKNDKDSTLFDSRVQGGGRPQQMMIQAAPFKGSFEDGLTMVSKGDSVTFFVNADTLFAKMNQPMPPTVKKGTDIKYIVKVLNIQTETEFQKAMESTKAKQLAIDAKIIDDYIAKNGLKTTKTASGLHYIVRTTGVGATIPKGQIASVLYKGMLLDGKEFDSSEKQGGKPVDFPIGVGAVVPGWDEGVQTMSKGGKSTFIIPSSLAYGEAGSPGVIPSNAVLVFDVELVDIKKNVPQQQPQMPTRR
jgi:FKBP-type peptidyl-prolyl cis-trans isomerase FkpA